MPTTALIELTGTTALNLIAGSGIQPSIGSWDAARIDLDKTNNGTSAWIFQAFYRMSTVIDAEGLDHTLLDDTTEFPFAFRALQYYSLFWYWNLAWGEETGGKNCKDKEFYKCKLKEYAQNTCAELERLGIEKPFSIALLDNLYEWCATPYELLSATSVGPCELK